MRVLQLDVLAQAAVRAVGLATDGALVTSVDLVGAPAVPLLLGAPACAPLTVLRALLIALSPRRYVNAAQRRLELALADLVVLKL